jgi:hypothetical protein
MFGGPFSLIVLMISSTSSLKPRLSMRSASSSTAYLRTEKSKFFLSMWSLTRPVVPTKISTPRLSWYGEHVIFSFRVFECIELFGNLQGQFAGGSQNHSEGFALTK